MRPSIQDNMTSSDLFATSYIAGNLSQMQQAQQQQAQQPMPMPEFNRSKSTDKTKTLLPIDFEPSEYSVICGNKRAFFNSAGNRRFRVICQMHLPEYMNAPSKHEKSFVVTKVMRVLKDACPVGAFVSLEKGRWWEVSDRTCREKCGTFFRDCLSDKYKSSSKNKVAQRKKKRTQFVPSAADNAALYHSYSSPPSPSFKPLVTAVPPPAPFTPLTAAPLALRQDTTGKLVDPLRISTPLVDAVAKALDHTDDQSIGSSSSGSFYDVDDLTPMWLSL